MNIEISIIIPIYNADKFLSECLDSIIAQDYDLWKCVLINDGSTDKSLDICQSYQKKDSRFIIINQKNLGSNAARQQGINLATEKNPNGLITFIDADDIIDKNYLSKMFEPFTLQDNYDVDVVYCQDLAFKDSISLKDQISQNQILK
ncbi:MAG: glycosyltransferase family 2 protein, partial [Candidatus Ancillula sp.]|nr:glycosyltransferase family 2 protein [Candidatus Ancillula sp.]